MLHYYIVIIQLIEKEMASHRREANYHVFASFRIELVTEYVVLARLL